MSSSGTKLYSEEIRALAWQGYSLRLSKNSFVLNTSDIGPVRFLKDEAGKWFSMSALDTISPDRKLVASIYWHEYQNKFVTLCLMDAGNNPRNATRVLHRIPTKLKVSNRATVSPVLLHRIVVGSKATYGYECRNAF